MASPSAELRMSLEISSEAEILSLGSGTMMTTSSEILSVISTKAKLAKKRNKPNSEDKMTTLMMTDSALEVDLEAASEEASGVWAASEVLAMTSSEAEWATLEAEDSLPSQVSQAEVALLPQ